MAFSPSPEQAACLDWVQNGSGNLVIEAVAGAGKTTTLVEMIKRMGGKVFVGAYNKKMADELGARVTGIVDVKAGTFHSAGMGTLRYVLKLGRDSVQDKKVRYIVEEMTKGTPQAEWTSAITKLVGLAKQMGVGIRGLSEDTIAVWEDLVERHDVDAELPEGPSVTTELIRLAKRALAASNANRDVIDFDDMIYLPLLLNLRFFRCDWVLVDEAQDTNPTRREMAARMLAPGGRLVAVGDPHQAIFGFTGADNDSLDLIRRRFEAQTLRLSTTYRCPKAIVAVANEYVSHIHASPTAPDGEHLDMTRVEMRQFVEAGDAVLCRFNKHLVGLCFSLIRAGLPARMEGRSIGEGLAALAGRWKVKSLDVLLERLDVWSEREKAKASERDDDAKIERIDDQYETMKVLIERGAEQGITTIGGLQTMIRSMFDDSTPETAKRLIVLSSVHRSKGLEWNRVFVLGRRELMPSPRARQPWQKEQEINLCYVAVTRAKCTLVDVALEEEKK